MGAGSSAARTRWRRRCASGGGVLMILLMTRTVWTTGVMLLDLVIVGGLAWGVTWLVGLIPITRRNLLSVLLSAVSAMFKPVAGTYKGRVPHLGNAHRVAGRIEQISLDSAREAEEQSPPPVQQPERGAPAGLGADSCTARQSTPGAGWGCPRPCFLERG